ncbi:hypothetical protein [Paenibacillus sp. Y412MC10]|uniref:hypothetical protein n=1 Tax=Geobacillus sp. (strain Y412MC10) TaxID=481743 RepID=UPI00119DC93D|nr:hypothetical protein [Paenibacillus sp. Y412MC10]
MAENHDWNRPKSEVTPELIISIMEILIDNIGKNGGRWTTKIQEVMNLNGETDEEEYGTYRYAIDIAIKQFGLKFDKAGRNGRTYSIDTGGIADYHTYKAKHTTSKEPFRTSYQITITCPHCDEPTNYTIDITENR